MTQEVAIVGIGIHPFGRTKGVSGMQQGVIATRLALADAGIRPVVARQEQRGLEPGARGDRRFAEASVCRSVASIRAAPLGA